MSWRNDPIRHGLASRGVETVSDMKSYGESELEPRTEFEEKYFFNHIGEEEEKIWKKFPHDIKKYFLPLPNFSIYYDMINKPEYFERAKGKTYDIVLMNPERYKDLVIEGFGYGQRGWATTENRVDELKEIVEEGERFPMLSLDYSGNSFNQEGRHRAELMQRLGLDKVPVFVVWDVDDNEPIAEVDSR